MALHFRHDSVRPFQKDLMEDIYAALSEGRNFMAQAPTGLGKTDASLSAAITHALETDRTVFFLTPKISQHRIAMEAARGIAKKNNLDIRAVDVLGRSHCCIDESLLPLDNESFHSACAKKRKDKQCEFYSNARGHGRVAEALAESRFKVVLEDYGAGKDHSEMVALGRAKKCCPYEWLLKLASVSNVIIADYYHLMVPAIRDVFLMKIKKRVEDAVVIVDEAHNLAPRIRSSMSRSINTFTFARMGKEMRFLGLDAGPVEEEWVRWGATRLLEKRECVIRPDEFHSFIEMFGLSVEEAVAKLEDTGEKFVEKTGRKSACLRLARFLAEWGMEDRSVRILKRKGESYQLSRKLLDPSPATAILNECAGSVLMSGTLLPLEMHRDILGLAPEKTLMKSYPSPFPRSGIVNIVCDDVTTRFSRRSDEEFCAIAKKLDSVIARTPGGVAVFFPSYGVMKSVLPMVLSRNLIVQRPGMKPAEVRDMLREFKGGGVLCGVQGGSLSEGVDYPEGQIKTVVIVGVALEEMGLETQALIDYYDEKFGRGWDYGYLYPGTIKALQAAGRARRKESDRVSVIYMDERFRWNKYNWILDKKERTVVSGSPEREVASFWEVKV
ncbi:MAG TPA: ATP-dependent DNA helicase [Candidatus Bilamarchaeum sp.]|nr:ATP-dependent DNA helicase [Candidatus Bilamarchaeum sp.]